MARAIDRVRTIGLVLVLAGLTSQVMAAGDPARGKAVFQRCAICHRDAKDAGNGLGPNLFGVVGRKAGTVAGFSYSGAMKGSGIVWSVDKLTAYVEQPKTVVPGNKMAFAGVPASQADDVVAYLATLK